MTSFADVPTMTSTSVASPRLVASSISGMFDSALAPGPKKDSDWSSVRRSSVPEAPATETESVFVAVAPPQGAGTAPKRSCPPASILRMASEPGVIAAVIAFVAGLYAHDSAAAVAGAVAASAEPIAASSKVRRSGDGRTSMAPLGIPSGSPEGSP
jgi:hypothetical protein